MTSTRIEVIAGLVTGAIVLPFAIYFSVVVAGTILGGYGYSLAGKPGAMIGSFGGALVSCVALVLVAMSLARLVARRCVSR